MQAERPPNGMTTGAGGWPVAHARDGNRLTIQCLPLRLPALNAIENISTRTRVFSGSYPGDVKILWLYDPLGHRTTFGYNGIGLVTSVADALQNTTQFSYDFADLIGVTDPLLNRTSMFHDAAGRVVTRTDPLGHTTKFQFNKMG